MSQWHSRIIFISYAILTIAAASVWSVVWALEEPADLEVSYFDVGQGDAIFIETPDRYQVLIDGGPDARVLEKLGRVMPAWDSSIDLVILTHPHADHISGLVDVLERYDIGAIIEPNVSYGTAEYAAWKRAESAQRISSYNAIAGMEVALGRVVRLRILAPIRDAAGQTLKNPHDANVMTIMAYGSTTFLFTGDGEAKEEREVVARGLPHGISVLKVGHHGSRTSTSPHFLDSISPEIAIISAGAKNRYGHPHQEILDRLTSRNIQIFRTDLDGDITISSDGKRILAEGSRSQLDEYISD